MRRFRDRYQAGEALGEVLRERIGPMSDGIVLGLPRGGVPVAARVAAALELPLDVFIVRKLGLPGHAEYAMGAIASGGVTVLNEDAVRRIGIDEAAIDAVADRERRELERREKLYRGTTAPLTLESRSVVIVDDGIATGSSMRAAIEAIRTQRPLSVTVGIPVAPRSAAQDFSPLVDAFVAVSTPTPFHAVGMWYQDFTQTTDDEVRSLLSSE